VPNPGSSASTPSTVWGIGAYIPTPLRHCERLDCTVAACSESAGIVRCIPATHPSTMLECKPTPDSLQTRRGLSRLRIWQARAAGPASPLVKKGAARCSPPSVPRGSCKPVLSASNPRVTAPAPARPPAARPLPVGCQQLLTGSGVALPVSEHLRTGRRRRAGPQGRCDAARSARRARRRRRRRREARVRAPAHLGRASAVEKCGPAQAAQLPRASRDGSARDSPWRRVHAAGWSWVEGTPSSAGLLPAHRPAACTPSCCLHPVLLPAPCRKQVAT
jgi:hypothetical protein